MRHRGKPAGNISTMSDCIANEEENYNEADGVDMVKKESAIEKEYTSQKFRAQTVVSNLAPADDLPKVEAYVPQTLSGALFCGPMLTNLDCIAGAIGAAELYGGFPARATEVSPETEFALKLWGAEKPRPIEELLVEYPTAGVCLVDHQQMSMLSPAVEVTRIVGVIDHHALHNATIVTDMPIYIDIRPWGSMSTIITHNFVMLHRRPKKSTAGMLLSAILSDTLNLQGPTTTQWDKLMVAVLVEIVQVEDLAGLVRTLFKAKSSDLANLSAMELVEGDQKIFAFREAFKGSLGFSMVETTDDVVILNKTPELLQALLQDKVNKELGVSILAVVNIVSLKATLLLCGGAERSLAQTAFPQCDLVNEHTMDLGGMVSRKKVLLPAVKRAIKKGWKVDEADLVHVGGMPFQGK